MDELSYGEHSPLGKTLDVPEERDSGSYRGTHRRSAADMNPLTVVKIAERLT